MYAVERQRWLVDHARDAGRLDVNQAADSLGVARETVRRDLGLLERNGLVRRVHGGAIPIDRLGFEGPLHARTTERREAKHKIAKHALGLVGAAESVYIDEGSTCQVLADFLTPTRPLTVVTNALPVATVMAAKPEVSVMVLGGRVRSATLGTTEHWALRMLEDLVIDLAFLGTNGITVDHGLTAPDSTVAAVKTQALAQSRAAVLLCDGAKFGADSSYRFARADQLRAVVTDRSAPSRLLRRLRETGPEVVVV